ncbi:3-hydroxyacyl-CoA dehydrogenase NAD-binding domain-containing protein [bacterium]|nr:3-hydroxyacyl-CoA dehydrogenase NAD-binding domain-containing protein [bacterium]
MNTNLTHSEPVAGQVHVTERDGVYTIFLGTEEERVVTLTSERVASLKQTVIELRDLKASAVIISGPRQDMFAAGADINAIQSITDPVVGEELGKEGQAIFQMIEDLPCTTIAAISGPCVGGGCELALACNFRLLSHHPSSQIGLPETKLGILPGWGGTQRLPRLIGIQKALQVILPGRTLRPKQAKSYGLVHEVVAPDDILERAEEIAQKKNLPSPIEISFLDWLLTYTRVGRFFVKRKSEAALQKETKGHYPAPPAALKAVLLGLEKGTKVGYEHEAAELGRLVVTPESRALVGLFFLTEGAKKLGKSARGELSNLRTTVIGAGTMGAGIAHVLAGKKFPVILKDTSPEALERGKEQITKSLAKKKHISSSDREALLSQITFTTDPEPNRLQEVQLVVEAIVENMEVKKSVLRKISEQVAENAIIASNTSSLSISEIASELPHPGRVVGMHFFNPVEKMPLVEIVRGKKTDDRTVVLIAALTTKLGKFPIVVEDVPGFLVNRILTPYLNEAGRLLADGYNGEEIDRAATAFGMPMGPLRLLDEVGLDVARHVSKIMSDGYGERMKNSGYVDKLVEQKMLGKKSGLGFYDYSEKKERIQPNLSELLGIDKQRTVGDRQAITDRLIMSLINEGLRCLDEGVAGTPGKEAAAQIDLGTVMGIGFPPFRGGLITYAQTLGPKNILQKLQHLEKEHGPHFRPHPGITSGAPQQAVRRGEN